MTRQWGAGLVAVLPVVAGACIYQWDKDPIPLSQGDVTGVLVGVPPGEISLTRKGLPGGRVRVERSVLMRSSGDKGRFVIRDLPEGQYSLSLFYDANRDGEPDLARTLRVPIRIPSGESRRPSVNLGEIELLPPGTLKGRVESSAGLEGVVVVLADSTYRVMPDPVTGAFEVPGVGEGDYDVVAVGGGHMSQKLNPHVTSGETTELGEALRLQAVAGEGTLQATLQEGQLGDPVKPGSLSQGLGAVESITLFPLAGSTTPVPVSPGETLFARVAPGVYVLEVRVEGCLPLRLPPLVIQQDQALDLGALLVTPDSMQREGQCQDLDGDGLCADLQEGRGCVQTCLDPSAGPAASCATPQGDVDCDDDADGEADVEERGVPERLIEACNCGPYGPPDSGEPCTNDPSRADRDHDGICDAFDLLPGCPFDRVPCAAAAPPDGGAPDAAVLPDAGSEDAGAADAGVPDAATPDAALSWVTPYPALPAIRDVVVQGNALVLAGVASGEVDLGNGCAASGSLDLPVGVVFRWDPSSKQCAWLTALEGFNVDVQALAADANGQLLVGGSASGPVSVLGTSTGPAQGGQIFVIELDGSGAPVRSGSIRGQGTLAAHGLWAEGNGARLVGQTGTDPWVCQQQTLARDGLIRGFTTQLDLDTGGCSPAVVVSPVAGGRLPQVRVHAASPYLGTQGTGVVSLAGALDGPVTVGLTTSTNPVNVNTTASAAVFLVRVSTSALGATEVSALVLAEVDATQSGVDNVRVSGLEDAQADGSLRVQGTVSGAMRTVGGVEMAVRPFGPITAYQLSYSAPGTAQGWLALHGDVSDRFTLSPRFLPAPPTGDGTGRLLVAGSFAKAFLREAASPTQSSWLLASQGEPAPGGDPVFLALQGAGGEFRPGPVAVPQGVDSRVAVEAVFPAADGAWLVVGTGGGPVRFGEALDCDGTPRTGAPEQLAGGFLWMVPASWFDSLCTGGAVSSSTGDVGGPAAPDPGQLDTDLPVLLDTPDDADCYQFPPGADFPTLNFTALGADGTCSVDTVVTAWGLSANGVPEPYPLEAPLAVDDAAGTACAAGTVGISPNAGVTLCVSAFAGQVASAPVSLRVTLP